MAVGIAVNSGVLWVVHIYHTGGDLVLSYGVVGFIRATSQIVHYGTISTISFYTSGCTNMWTMENDQYRPKEHKYGYAHRTINTKTYHYLRFVFSNILVCWLLYCLAEPRPQVILW